MIQRIQSIYLTAAAALVLLTLIFNYYEATVTADDQVVEKFEVSALELNYRDYENEVHYYETPAYLLGLSVLGFLMAGGTVFLYRNRKLQVRISRLTILVIAAKVLLVFFYYKNKADELIQGTISNESFDVGIYLSLAAMIFLMLAQRSIIKDEQLVRSADRLR